MISGLEDNSIASLPALNTMESLRIQKDPHNNFAPSDLSPRLLDESGHNNVFHEEGPKQKDVPEGMLSFAQAEALVCGAFITPHAVAPPSCSGQELCMLQRKKCKSLRVITSPSVTYGCLIAVVCFISETILTSGEDPA